jgi:hypothetical protein
MTLAGVCLSPVFACSGVTPNFRRRSSGTKLHNASEVRQNRVFDACGRKDFRARRPSAPLDQAKSEPHRHQGPLRSPGPEARSQRQIDFRQRILIEAPVRPGTLPPNNARCGNQAASDPPAPHEGISLALWT